MLEIISPTIVLDTLVGTAMEKAATLVYEKHKKTDNEKTAKTIKAIIDKKIHSNTAYSYLLDWNEAVQVSNLLLLDFLKEEGIYKSLKLYQERHGFYNNDGALIKPDAELSEVSKDLSNSLRQELKLKDIVAEFDKEYKEAERDANDERMRVQLDQILNKLERMLIHDDNDIYLHEFGDTLFLDKGRNRCVTLEKMYCSPDIIMKNGKVGSAAEVINNWVMHDDDHSVLLLFGDAGVGKSSLCRKMVWDALIPNNSRKEFCIKSDKIHVIALRKHLSVIEKWEARFGVWELLKMLFDINRSPCRNELFVLDGLDEVEVLCPNFPIDDFFDDLQLFAEYDMKIMITSRRTDHIKKYGEKAAAQEDSRIQCHSLFWEDGTVQNWCEQYSRYRFDLDYDKWMRKFLGDYNKLPPCDSDDSRREILRIPIVLYIVCNAEVDLQEDSSVCRIYDQAFRTILNRDHISTSTMRSVFDSKKSPAEAIARQVQWQFTKELAFQMYLHKSLTLSDAEQPNAMANAFNRSIKLLGQKKITIPDCFKLNKEAYFAVFHFARGDSSKNGVAFAHKTVYEYFTAVKLYEDYLAITDIDQYSPESLNLVWGALIEAFRYKRIDSSVLGFLSELQEKRGKLKIDFIKESFFWGICKQKILALPYERAPIDEYITKEYRELPTDQWQLIFSNITMYMAKLGYCNKHLNQCNRSLFEKCLSIIFQAYTPLQKGNTDKTCLPLHFENWILTECILQGAHLGGAHLEGAHLEGANLKNTDLTNVHLEGAHLEGAHLEGTNLRDKDLTSVYFEGAHLEGAHLEGANLKNTDLTNVHLEGAHLEGAHLEGANLKNTDLTSVHLKGVHLEGAHLEGAQLIGANLEGAYLRCTHLENTNMQGSNLECAHLETAYLEGAKLHGAILRITDLRDAHLEGLHLEGAHLEEVHLNDAHLEGAHLEGVYLGSAYLEGAHLNDAHLEGAHLEGANLLYADLDRTHLEGAHYDEFTLFPYLFSPETNKMKKV